MKTTFKIAVIAITLVMMLLADVPLLRMQLVPEAQAIFGVRRRTAVVAYSAGAASGEAAAAASQQQAAAAQQQAAAAQQKAAAAATPPPPAAAGQPLPVGTVVSALPKGCVSTPVGGVEYYYCGGNFYRAVFQGNQLVYVTAQPK
jgi:hypothetical protein